MESSEEFCCCIRQRIEQFENEAIFTNLHKPPSLQDITLVSIAINLWESIDMQTSINDILFNNQFVFRGRDEEIYKNISLLVLPDSLKLKISNIVEPIRRQYLLYISRDDLHCSNGLCCWTMDGTIDYIKQFKELLKTFSFADVNENRQLIWLACEYCLEDIILDLKLEAYLTEDVLDELKSEYRFHIILYWNSVTNNEIHRLLEDLKEYDFFNIYDAGLSIYVNMVSSSIFSYNIIGLKYFWPKLTEEEIISNAGKWTKLSKNILNPVSFRYQAYNVKTDIMCFLLSNLTKHKKQMEFIKAHAELILRSLFNSWPHQKYFLPTITALFNFLEETAYVRIMNEVANEIQENKTTHLFLREVWNLSCLHLKKSFLGYLSSKPTALARLLQIGDNVTIDIILNYASTAEKRNIVFNIIKECHFISFLHESKINKTIQTIDLFALKHSDLFSIKQSIASEYAEKLCLNWMIKGEFQATGEFLNWIFPSDNEAREFKQNHINPIDIYRRLIHSSDYNPVDNFLKWYFETEEDILFFKKQNIHEIKCDTCELFLMKLCVKGGVGWDNFQSFVKLRFNCLEEIGEFKKVYLNCIPSFLMAHAYEFADIFVNWCFDSLDEVARFKRELLLSEKGLDILLQDVEDMDFRLMVTAKRVLTWFKPLYKDIIIELKISLCKFRFCKDNACDRWEEAERRQIFFDYLDSLF